MSSSASRRPSRRRPRPRGSTPRDAIATTAERDEHAERRQQGVAAARANLHRRVRRPSVEERLQRPAVMGIVNVTPDSFSDGGVHLDPDAAAAAARRMLEEGAAIVDVGGESTRPGSEGVSLDEELRRVVPVLERLDGRAGLDRHGEGRGRAPRARARRRARQRRHRAARRPRARRRRRRRAARTSA